MQHIQSKLKSVVGNKNNTMERRDFLRLAVGAGFAVAVFPASAKTVIHTDTEGLSEGEFSLDIGGQAVPVYMAQPKDKNNLPVVIVISEVYGLTEHVSDVVRRFAKQGYLALAPELFIRQGDPANYDNVTQIIKEVASKVPDAQVLTDLDACVAWAKRNGGDPTKIAVAGFGWGGRVAWLYAAHNPDIKTGLAWYGRLITDTSSAAINPQNPINIAPTLTVPILGFYAGKDNGIPLASIQLMKEALAQGASHSDIMIYPKSGNGFYADNRISYVADDAKDSWKHGLDWLRSHGIE
jgi:carboxymethylenebutenolidase